MASKKRKISELTSNESEQIVQSLSRFMEGLDQNDEETKGITDAIQSLFAKLHCNTVHTTSALDLNERRIYPYGLEFKEGAEVLARQQGTRENENNFLTLPLTKCLVSLVTKHVSRASEAGCRMLIDVILLRLASTFNTENECLHIVPEYTIMKRDLASKRSFDGVVDYLVAKHHSIYSKQILDDPLGMLNRPDIARIGSSNIFEARTLDSLLSSVPQVILAAAAACRQTNKECSRGAITCGDQWIFFAYQAPKGDNPAKYARTTMLRIGDNGENLDLILGILDDWVENAEAYAPQKYFDLI